MMNVLVMVKSQAQGFDVRYTLLKYRKRDKWNLVALSSPASVVLMMKRSNGIVHVQQ